MKVQFSWNFAYVKFCENKIVTKWRNYSVFYSNYSDFFLIFYKKCSSVLSSLSQRLSVYIFSCTTDWDFCCFYPCEIILPHIPIPGHGKDRNQTATRWRHAGCTSICDVIEMLKWCHHVISLHIQVLLETFFMFYQYIIVNEYDQEIPQSQTADNPMAPRGRANQPSGDTRKTN